jgi:hypothetical protein
MTDTTAPADLRPLGRGRTPLHAIDVNVIAKEMDNRVANGAAQLLGPVRGQPEKQFFVRQGNLDLLLVAFVLALRIAGGHFRQLAL